MLVHRTDFWTIKISDNEIRVESHKTLICPICSNLLKPHHISSPRRVHEGYAVDIHFKCPVCGFFTTFGIPVSEEVVEALKKHANKIFTYWVIEEDDERVKERLRRWGYW